MRYIETLKDRERISEVYLCKSKSIALTIDFDLHRYTSEILSPSLRVSI